MKKIFASSVLGFSVLMSQAVPMGVDTVHVMAAGKDFTDVSSKHWAYSTIIEMRDQNIISGYPDGRFGPGESISRKQVAALLSRALPLKPSKQAVVFKDVPANHPYYNDIKKVQQAGIFDGANGKFNPNANLTRAQMAKVLDLAFHLEAKGSHDFPDVPKNHWSSQHIDALFSNGITTGDNGKFKPNEPVTRAQYAVFLNRALNMGKGEVTPKPDPAPTPTPEPKPEPKPDPVPTPPKEMTMEQFNQQMKSNPLFKAGIRPTNKYIYNTHLRPVLIEGQAIAKKYGMKYTDIFTEISFEEDGYVSTLPIKSAPEVSVDGMTNSNKNTTNIKLDFTRPAAVNLSIEMLELLHPDIKIADSIRAKAAEAKNAWETEGHLPVNQRSFTGNGETLTIGEKQVRIGANKYLEGFWIDVSPLAPQK